MSQPTASVPSSSDPMTYGKIGRLLGVGIVDELSLRQLLEVGVLNVRVTRSSVLIEIVDSIVIDNSSALPWSQHQPTVSDLHDMYEGWFQHHPDQWEVMALRIENADGISPELVTAALTRLQKKPGVVQNCFFKRALRRADGVRELFELLEYASTDEQAQHVVEYIMARDISCLSIAELLLMAQRTKESVIPLGLNRMLAHRAMSSPDWSLEQLCALYTLCVKSSKEERRVRSVITRWKVSDMVEGRTFAVCGTILDSVPVGSPLWNSCLRDVDDMLPDVAAPKDDAARLRVAEMAARIRRLALRLDGTVPPLQLYANLLDALEEMVSTREEAISYWQAVRKDREEDPDRWARACTLVREHSKEPELEGSVSVPG